MAPPRIDPLTRFAAKYRELANGCWEWLGGKTPEGYGMFRPGGADRNNVGAHRWAYQTFKAPIPAGFDLDHLCRNPGCVNPAHLEPVTTRTNINRGRRYNAEKTHCIRGHAFTPENTRIGKRGNRICRRCKALHANARYHGLKLGE